MPYILSNKNLEIQIDLPEENYNQSRFDWTGKIRKVTFQGICLTTIENEGNKNNEFCGSGFYNEFGIDAPIGYDETNKGEWFHKIGIGLLKKEEGTYLFNKKYKVKPAEFNFKKAFNKVIINCKSEDVNGYSYMLKKEIELFENSFVINYFLENTGKKTILTNEYNHNFIAINKDLIGNNYVLKFPFDIKPAFFGETVNPEQKVDIGINEIKFNGSHKEQFFFSNLTGDKNVEASWEIINLKNNIGIKETGSFQTSKVNLWGWNHVISPELFFEINAKPGKSVIWSRTYNMYPI